MLKTFQRLCLAAALSWAVAITLHGAETAAPSMARIPAGVYRPFYRGANDPKAVRVPAFALDVLPVTNGEFLEFVRTHPQWRRSQVKRLFADEFYLQNWAGDLELGTNALATAPATFVSWFAAKAYAQAQGKRLPTLAEWEYAASASTTRPDGDNDPAFKQEVLTWYTTPAATHPATVGQRPTNYWGLHDLHGLVWEWVVDFNSALLTSDTRGGGTERQFFCGAGAQGAGDVSNFPAFMRYGFRSSLQAAYCVRNLGFRCAKDL